MGRLRVSNSLCSQEKVKFSTKDGSQNVSWYVCGPTVYDSSHLGHARTYVSFDILRRILEDYFHYKVRYVMNITDVDDKIIKRARRNHLLDEYVQTAKHPELVLLDVQEAFRKEMTEQAIKVKETESELFNARPSQRSALQQKLDEERDKIAQLEKAHLTASVDTDCRVTGLAAYVLSSLLDDRGGANVTDHSIFHDLAARYEKEFFEDLDQLGVKPPDVITRVTEYMDKIIDYIDAIVSKGFAYEANGSVYFDTIAFREAGHLYPKLRPSALGSLALSSEGESSFLTGDKRNPSDFALWKKSKPGEPYWDCKWGPGRPGWHIECSAMASDVFGSTLDIHAGGKDLEFPHHDNELAQSEAYHGCSEWVRYFLHSGHLSINSRKMSKSLKNFTTIRDALRKHTARQLRMYFVMHAWDKPLDYSVQAVEMAVSKEKHFERFFANVRHHLKESPGGRTDPELETSLKSATEKVQLFMEDNFNTPEVIDCLSELVKDANAAIENSASLSREQIEEVALFVTNILRVLGLVQVEHGKFGVEPYSVETTLERCIDQVVYFRDALRATAKGNSSMVELREKTEKCVSSIKVAVKHLETEQASAFVSVVERIDDDISKGRDLMELSDTLREQLHLKLSVALEDGQSSTKWQFVQQVSKTVRKNVVEESKLRKEQKKLRRESARFRKDSEDWKQLQEKIADISAKIERL